MLTILTALLVCGIISIFVSIFFVDQMKNIGTSLFFVVTMYIGVIMTNVGFWGLVLYFVVTILKDVL